MANHEDTKARRLDYVSFDPSRPSWLKTETQGEHGGRHVRSGETRLVGREQTAPGALGLRLVIHLPVGRTPAVGCLVDVDLGLESGLLEGLAQDILLGRALLVVVLRSGDQKPRLAPRGLQVRAVRPVGDEHA